MCLTVVKHRRINTTANCLYDLFFCQCQQRAAVTLESSHPLGASGTQETVTMRGATSLEVKFGRTGFGHTR